MRASKRIRSGDGVVDMERAWEEHMGEEMIWAKDPANGQLLLWQEGVWVNKEKDFGELLQAAAGWSMAANTIDRAKGAIAATAHSLDGTHKSVPWEEAPDWDTASHEWGSAEPRINFRNGWLDVNSGEFNKHGRPWRTLNQIPHDYIEDATDEEVWEATSPLDEWLRTRVDEEEDVQYLVTLLGTYLLPGNKEQLLHVLSGDKGSGKSTMANLIEQVLGAGNAHSLRVDEFGNAMSLSDLHGKLWNNGGDIDADKPLPAYTVLMQLTGRDPIAVNPKYLKRFTMRWNGGLIICCNGLLTPPGQAGLRSGIWRRIVYVFFPHSIDEDDRLSEAELFAEIAPDLNLLATRAARQFMRSVQAGGRVLVQTEAMKNALGEAQGISSPVLNWVRGTLVEDPGGRVTGAQMYEAHCKWREDNGHSRISNVRFYEEAKVVVKADFGVEASRTGATRNVFTGISMKGDTSVRKFVKAG